MKNQFENSKTRRELILMFLFQYQASNKYPPSIREISEYSGITSTSVVSFYLDRLKKDGYIQRNRRVSRGTFILPDGESLARSLLGIKQATHCDHCNAPVGNDGLYLEPRVPTKIQKKNRQSVYPTAA